MAETGRTDLKPASSPREPGARAARPRDAATLIVYRVRRGRVEVLMGERHAAHRFQPQRYVFPGGRVDPTDSRVRHAGAARSDVLARLTRTATPARARGLLAAAVRETFEETGLLIGRSDPEPARPAPRNWRPFFDTGMAPDFSRIDYVARAITPPTRPIRFNARFFMIDAHHAAGNLGGSGELLNLTFVPLDETHALEMPLITQRILEKVGGLALDPPAPSARRRVPFFRMINGTHVVFPE